MSRNFLLGITQFYSFAWAFSVSLAPFTKQIVLSLLNIANNCQTFVGYIYEFIPGFCFISLVYVSVVIFFFCLLFACSTLLFDYYKVWNQEVWCLQFCFSFSRLTIWGPFCFIQVLARFVISVKKSAIGIFIDITLNLGFPGGSDSKDSACNSRDPGSIPGFGRSPGEGHGNLLQYFCLENSIDRRSWQATVPGIAQSWTWLCN